MKEKVLNWLYTPIRVIHRFFVEMNRADPKMRALHFIERLDRPCHPTDAQKIYDKIEHIREHYGFKYSDLGLRDFNDLHNRVTIASSRYEQLHSEKTTQ